MQPRWGMLTATPGGRGREWDVDDDTMEAAAEDVEVD